MLPNLHPHTMSGPHATARSYAYGVGPDTGRRPARLLDLLLALTKEHTMTSVNTLRRTAGVAAAVAAIALAAPVFGITATPNLLGTQTTA